MRTLELHDLVENVLVVTRPALAMRGGSVENRIDPGLELTAHAGRLGQILHHLLADAIERIETIGTSGHIALMAGLESDAAGERILLTLRDNGVPPSGATQAGQLTALVLVQEITGASLESHLANGGSHITLKLPRRME